jgi:lipopolysaccharide biosynthesis glycosyltransferase
MLMLATLQFSKLIGVEPDSAYLNEMYSLDFNDNYVLGFYDIISDGVDYLGLKSDIYINAGVLLLNLKKIREDEKAFELFNITNSKMELKDNDQTVLNYVLYPKIGRLPSKYGIFNFEDTSDINVYLNRLRTKIPFDELEEAFKNPSIIHIVLCYQKPWSYKTAYLKSMTNCGNRESCSCKKYFDLWHSIAKKTDYYDIISRFTGVNKK